MRIIGIIPFWLSRSLVLTLIFVLLSFFNFSVPAYTCNTYTEPNSTDQAFNYCDGYYLMCSGEPACKYTYNDVTETLVNYIVTYCAVSDYRFWSYSYGDAGEDEPSYPSSDSMCPLPSAPGEWTHLGRIYTVWVTEGECHPPEDPFCQEYNSVPHYYWTLWGCYHYVELSPPCELALGPCLTRTCPDGYVLNSETCECDSVSNSNCIIPFFDVSVNCGTNTLDFTVDSYGTSAYTQQMEVWKWDTGTNSWIDWTYIYDFSNPFDISAWGDGRYRFSSYYCTSCGICDNLGYTSEVNISCGGCGSTNLSGYETL
ncbi:MAG: hypothetical protein HY806_00435 [Nitrospirae bacterium]|nr:hypothetical protein [Nitrospirota bacterium]